MQHRAPAGYALGGPCSSAHCTGSSSTVVCSPNLFLKVAWRSGSRFFRCCTAQRQIKSGASCMCWDQGRRGQGT